MVPRQISSAQHPIVKRLVKLREDKDFRREEKSVLIMGEKLVREVSPLKILIVDREFPGISAGEVYIATPEILKKITGLQNPEGIAAEVALPPPGDLKGKKFVLALDEISDPGNLGTLLRTSLALGWDAVFLTPGTTDPFNDKALRAAQGATFRLPLCTGNWDLVSKFHVYVADAKGKSVETVAIQTPALLVLGNEARGASSWAREHGTAISIPMAGQMESLNVAGAGAILMYTLKRKI